jgi:hypothetical protein
VVVTGVPRDELARRGVAVPEPKPGLVGADGRRVEVPGPVFDALVQVATAMAHGQGVTVIPQNALLTTQEAAELLGISRPTLVRLAEAGTYRPLWSAGVLSELERALVVRGLAKKAGVLTSARIYAVDRG